MILLIPLFLVLLTALYLILDGKDFRADALKVFLTTFFLIGLSTELLSLITQLNRKGIFITWSLFNIAAISLLFTVWQKKRKAIDKTLPINKESFQQTFQIRGINLFIIALVIGITLYISLKAPPNNYDSMTYHMARIPHWIQNQSIQYYPTAIERQNYSMPLAEYAILHTQVLSKSDLYANLVQWFSFILSIMTVSLIAKQLKVSPRGQWISAVLAGLIPMAILQSSSTQNDLVVGIFCLAFFYFLNRVISERKWLDAIFAGLALGLALATKGTAYILCAGIGIGLGGAAIFGKKLFEIKALAVRFIMIITIGLLLNSGIFLRNWNLYRHPILTNNERTLVDKISPAILFANLARNGAIHLASPFQQLNNSIENSLVVILGSQAQNPASTFQNSEFELTYNINEDESGNNLHFILLSIGMVLYAFLPNQRNRERTIYLLMIVLSIILFSLAFKWQPWIARLQTPIFFLGCVMIGWLLDILIKRDIFLDIILLLFLLGSTPYLINNFNRPLIPLWENSSVFYNAPWKEKTTTYIKKITDPIPILAGKMTSLIGLLTYGGSIETLERQELYFLSNHKEYHWYKKAFQWIEDDTSTSIGLLMDKDDYEYPLWVLFDQHSSPGERLIYHVGIENITGTLENPYPIQPELIIITRSTYKDLPVLADYGVVYESKTIQMYKLKNPK